MIKIVDPSDYVRDEPFVQLIKRASRGTYGQDRRLFEKRASGSLISQFDNIVFKPGEEPVHLYALGTTEAVGPNRNWDGFPKRACEKHHNTFVKYARWYREHANRDPSKSYGIVKASAFNDAMQRIELIVALNATKEAAVRNGGLVADKEMEKLASGQSPGVSMSCRVPLDFCSYCGNAARTRDEYCRDISDGGHCKAGGLRCNIGRVLANGDIVHAINEDPQFFDISMVARPADRIAYVTGQLEKAASLRLRPEYLQLPPVDLLFDQLPSNHKLAKHVEMVHKMASMEQTLSPLVSQTLQVFGSQSTIPMTKEAQDSPQQALKALQEVGGVLSLAGFLQLFGGQSEKEAAETASYAGDQLPTCFSSLIIDGDIQEQLANHAYTAASNTTPTLRKWAASVSEQVSYNTTVTTKRAMTNAIREVVPQEQASPLIKLAGINSVVTQYAIYKSAAILDIFSQTRDIVLTATLALIQNRLT